MSSQVTQCGEDGSSDSDEIIFADNTNNAQLNIERSNVNNNQLEQPSNGYMSRLEQNNKELRQTIAQIKNEKLVQKSQDNKFANENCCMTLIILCSVILSVYICCNNFYNYCIHR